jgi:acetyltransferase
MRGDNLLIITNGGGVGVLSTDSAERYGIPLRFAPDDIQKALEQQMPEYGSAKNPVDLTGMARRREYEESTRYAYAHKWVDGLIILYCETDLTVPMEIVKGIKAGVDTSGVTGKPIIVSCVGGERSEQAMRWLVTNGIPAYNEPDTAVNAMAALRDYARNRELASQVFQPFTDVDESKARTIISQVRSRQERALTEIESKALFKAYGLPVTETEKATSMDEAVFYAQQMGFPVVAKIISPDILHKSDAGGVMVNLNDEAEVRKAYNTILSNAKAYNPDAEIHGVAIQEMAPWGTEVILGSINTPTFGPTMMFGLGGIFVEILKDVTFRVAPVPRELALRMLIEIKGAAILQGARGETARDMAVLAEVISRYSQMIYDLGDEILESDANPVIVYSEGEGVKIVDARLILKE